MVVKSLILKQTACAYILTAVTGLSDLEISAPQFTFLYRYYFIGVYGVTWIETQKALEAVSDTVRTL